MYKLLLVEDEKIERESLYSMIQSFDLPIEHIIVAENGEKGLLKYYEEQPDVILTDIDMPVLGGLDMIERIRKKDKKVMCLVITSYDYFSYAQKAIRLGVEDFVLKPYDKDVLRKSLTQTIETLSRNKNTYTQTSSLVQKMNEMKSLLESECFYTILTKRNDVKLIETFQLAGISPVSCCAIVFKEGVSSQGELSKLRGELEDLGYIYIQGSINYQQVCFVLSNRSMTHVDKELFIQILKSRIPPSTQWAIGDFQNELSKFYQTYEDARYNLNNDDVPNALQHKEESVYHTMAMDFSRRFIDHINDDPQQCIHELCQEFLHYNNNEINQILHLIVDQVLKECQKQYRLTLEKEDVFTNEVQEYSFQNLEIFVTQIFNKIWKPLKTMKYQNSSALIKKSMLFIEENYTRPISLNTLADELQVSPFYISKLFTKELGHNFTDIVNNIRIEQAKKLIRMDCPFKEIAYDVGFGSQSYFTKMFKKLVKMSPTDYRKLFP